MNTNASLEGETDAGDSANQFVATASGGKSFPLRTLMVCLTIWLIATEVLIFDQIKFSVRVNLLEQAARAIHGSQLLIPLERPSNLPDHAKMEKL